jgi:hypothetical protein
VKTATNQRARNKYDRPRRTHCGSEGGGQVNDVQHMQRLIEENEFFRSQVKQLMSPYCPKCGVVNDFHVNLYCRKIQALMKGIARLKQQLAIAKKGAVK